MPFTHWQTLYNLVPGESQLAMAMDSYYIPITQFLGGCIQSKVVQKYFTKFDFHKRLVKMRLCWSLHDQSAFDITNKVIALESENRVLSNIIHELTLNPDSVEC